MPAAAVTPAPIAYINIAAVKTLVVGEKGDWRKVGGRRKASHRRPVARQLARAAVCRKLTDALY